MHRPFTYKCKQTTRGEIKHTLYSPNMKSNNSVGIFINISFKDRLLIDINEIMNSVGDFLHILSF